MTVAEGLPCWPHFSHSPCHKSTPNFQDHKYPDTFTYNPNNTQQTDLSLVKQLLRSKKLTSGSQYVTLLGSHFNIELFKPQRKHNKSL